MLHCALTAEHGTGYPAAFPVSASIRQGGDIDVGSEAPGRLGVLAMGLPVAAPVQGRAEGRKRCATARGRPGGFARDGNTREIDGFA